MRKLITFGAILAIGGVSGCGDKAFKQKQLAALQRSSQSVVHEIGTDAIITFNPDGEHPVLIPIRGQGLYDQSLNWYVDLQGVAPLTYGTDYTFEFNPDGSFGLYLKLTGSYFRTPNVKTGDPLTITLGFVGQDEESKLKKDVDNAINGLVKYTSSDATDAFAALHREYENVISRKRVIVGNPTTQPSGDEEAGDAAKSKYQLAVEKIAAIKSDGKTQFEFAQALLRQYEYEDKPDLRSFRSFSTRRFILYTVDDYRSQYLKNRVPVQDISAFPLSETETKNLFGEIVGDEYYAVRVSFRDTSDKDILISTGMIKAYGQARVESQNGAVTSYSIPIEVVPQSREHVYSVVSDTKPYRTREIVFRALEFTGSLATAITTGFHGASDLIKGVGVFTGVGVPAGAKLWPDPVPQYLKNLVDYSMPDLVKVPRGTVMGHKYLFFSKKDLQALIPDSNNLVSSSQSSKEQPDVHVVYVSFDTLDVPMENVVQVADQTIPKRADAALGRIPPLSETLQQVVISPWRKAISARSTIFFRLRNANRTIARFHELTASIDATRLMRSARARKWAPEAPKRPPAGRVAFLCRSTGASPDSD